MQIHHEVKMEHAAVGPPPGHHPSQRREKLPLKEKFKKHYQTNHSENHGLRPIRLDTLAARATRANIFIAK